MHIVEVEPVLSVEDGSWICDSVQYKLTNSSKLRFNPRMLIIAVALERMESLLELHVLYHGTDIKFCQLASTDDLYFLLC